VLEIVRKARYLRVPTTVLVLSNLNFRWCLVCSTALLQTYCTCIEDTYSFARE
jgi:hypothetical protein